LKAVAEQFGRGQETQINGWYIVMAVLAVLAIQQWWVERQQVETIPYSQFEEMIDAGKIQSVRVTDKYVTGTLKETPPDGSGVVTLGW
jgi:cell division protease FtsH